MAPHFECENGPARLKGLHWFAHKTDAENAAANHADIEALAKKEGATFKEVKDDQGKPCTTLPNRYGTKGPIVK